ncbi:hypothetical protein AVL50_21135 [Flammeovirga sp. SJP92]|nr:hypothetical protein AVL50_21135 [Flammeovirga sp. SJP92]
MKMKSAHPQKQSMTHIEITERLSKYTTPEAATIFAHWILKYQIYVTIKGGRKTINGDYRPPQRGHGHKISINSTLNPYQFIITFTHEVAHLLTWDKYQNHVAPHGKEWKSNFGKLLDVLLNNKIFPSNLIEEVKEHKKNPSASSGNDISLKKALAFYDQEQDHSTLYLEDIHDNDAFSMEDGRIFIRNKKLRKYYLCTEKSTGKQFRINSLAKVKLLNNLNHEKAC